MNTVEQGLEQAIHALAKIQAADVCFCFLVCFLIVNWCVCVWFLFSHRERMKVNRGMVFPRRSRSRRQVIVANHRGRQDRSRENSWFSFFLPVD